MKSIKKVGGVSFKPIKAPKMSFMKLSGMKGIKAVNKPKAANKF